MDIYWIWLSMIPFIGPVFQKRLLLHFGSPQRVFQAPREELVVVSGINRRMIDSILKYRDLSKAQKIAEDIQRREIRLLRFCDALYPEHAKMCCESPILLFYKGVLRPIDNGVAVVGARRCSVYGRTVGEEIGRELALNRIPLVSGFAKGVDSYATSACLEKGGYTLSFLGGGVDVCYPKEQQSLYDRILDAQGVFLSAYPPGSKPHPKQFLERNALISAWSKEVVVVEAGEKSGALWTASYALKQKRQLYAVPHPIYSSEGKGCNSLLASGAEPYIGTGSLIRIKNSGDQCPIGESSERIMKTPSQILTLLAKSSLTIPQISHALSANEQQLYEDLITLELDGQISIRGNIVSRI